LGVYLGSGGGDGVQGPGTKFFGGTPRSLRYEVYPMRLNDEA